VASPEINSEDVVVNLSKLDGGVIHGRPMPSIAVAVPF
jgi:hypothetical protein